ncbi:protein atonal homolog 8-like [Acropora millepora]|uniref:protein atonal homolog 8-like n=1 Tax=Acropora millepora TaxID=45264 RepID=UPI0010FC8E34|nr:protein atonal homolog 8-like [Acropora millepora]
MRFRELSMCEIDDKIGAWTSMSVEYERAEAAITEDKVCSLATQDNADENTGNVKKKSRSQGAKKPRTKLKKAVSWRQSNRSRRLIANARERSRIHIMSEAFEGLRRAVPSYSSDQKLSKLAILRLATSYISALSYLAENDTSSKSLKHFADSVDQCTQALQTEGRAKRTKDDRPTKFL